jgi:hypothetical protein
VISEVEAAERLLMKLAELLGTKLVLHPNVAGDRWAAECVSQFVKACGEGSVIDVSSRQLPYDLLVCGKKVQCKKRSVKKTGQCSISKSPHRYTADQVDFFAICYGDEHYVIPFTALSRGDGSLCNEFFVCDYWKYRNAWNMPLVGHVSMKFLPLFMNGGQDGAQAG